MGLGAFQGLLGFEGFGFGAGYFGLLLFQECAGIYGLLGGGHSP